jgi:DNA-binding beta-propeller fold protein YncE
MNNKLAPLFITLAVFASCGKKNTPTPTAVKLTPSAAVTTLAGGGLGMATNGIGTAASFDKPSGMAVDSSGNVYVADTYDGKVRVITPGGQVSTLITTDGPTGVATDPGGNIYIADFYGNVIFGSAGGPVTIIAGGGSGTATNGLANAASFNNPYGVAVSTTGEEVYITDYGNNLIRKTTNAFSEPLNVSTFAGSGIVGATNGTGTAAAFHAPAGIAIDIQGNLYVADYGNNLIRKITPAGVVTTLAGGGQGTATNGNGVVASFNQPSGVAVDAAGNVYVADSGNHLIRKITAAGAVSTLAGNGVSGDLDGAGADAEFDSPQGIAVDAKGQNVYVCDYGNNLIRKITIATSH